MKTVYQFISMVLIKDTGKTTKWSVLTNTSKSELGEIKWYASWRKYCYFPTVQAVYSVGCLSDISSFINQLTKERK